MPNISISLKNIGLGHANMPSDMGKSSYVHAFSSFARFICVSLLFIILLSFVCECAICVQMSTMDNFIITTVKQFKLYNCQCQDLGQMYMDCQWEDLGQGYIWTVRYRNWLFAHSNYIVYVKHGCIISFKLSPNNLPLTEPQIILLLLKLKVNKKKITYSSWASVSPILNFRSPM